jgi:hypothetical protein
MQNTAASPPALTRMDKAISTTIQRAKTLLEDGYTVDPTDRTGVYWITSPIRIVKGQPQRHMYEVDLANHTCDCEMFQFSLQSRGVEGAACKHLLRAEAHVAEAARLSAPLFLSPRAQTLPAAPAPEKPVPTGNGKPSVYSRYAATAPSARAPFEGGYCDPITGEVLEESAPPAPSPRVIPVYGSEAWRAQVGKDFD